MIIFESFNPARYPSSYRFGGLVKVISAYNIPEIPAKLTEIEQHARSGYHLAGYLAYEASPGLSDYLSTNTPAGGMPLLWFGVYRDKTKVDAQLAKPDSTYFVSDWELSQSKGTYTKNIEKIRDYIAKGDTYQVNYTIKQKFRFSGDSLAYYKDLCNTQSAAFCAYMETGEYDILSASPELFFSLRGDTLTTSPMKGTIKRGINIIEDDINKDYLRNNEKEKAENLMIVDLLRNDMGKISVTGSVKVKSLFDIETLDTIHQMSSAIESKLKPGTGLADIFSALFPCGSITGAPKKRTMEIIKELETEPRGIYTGCIGYISPDNQAGNGIEAVFSVAIRTIVIDKEKQTGEIGIGSGITYDSSPESEYNECLIKSQFAREVRPRFELIETVLLDNGEYFLLERHLNRLRMSAKYFNFKINIPSVYNAFNELAENNKEGAYKVRLLLSRDGKYQVESTLIDNPGPKPGTIKTGKIIISKDMVKSNDIFLYHKTTNRELYSDASRNLGGDIADVIFCNERREVCEGANNNIVINLDGELLTPPVSSGLLPGTFREELLDNGIIKEQVITTRNLKKAHKIYLINSVRKWREVQLADLNPGASQK